MKEKLMDLMTFVSEIIKAIVWPITFILAIWMLRHIFKSILPNIKTLKYKDFEADFTKDLERAEMEARLVNLPPEEEAQKINVGFSESATDKYRRLSEISPRVAVIEAWRDVELALTAAASVYDFDNPQNDRSPNLNSVMERLTSEGQLDPGERDFLQYMRQLRNEASHRDIDLRSDQAYRYAMLASQMTAALNKKKRRDKPVVIQDVG